jgi:low affinity Fe/Cu permease
MVMSADSAVVHNVGIDGSDGPQAVKVCHGHRFPFRRCAAVVAWGAGHPAAFVTAVGIVVVWAITGPLFHFSDTWQLVINTGTTIVTFLMVFLIQNAQNRDTAAMQIKLDELIRAVHGARNNLIDVEQMEEEELIALRDRFHKLAERARTRSEASAGSPLNEPGDRTSP